MACAARRGRRYLPERPYRSGRLCEAPADQGPDADGRLRPAWGRAYPRAEAGGADGFGVRERARFKVRTRRRRVVRHPGALAAPAGRPWWRRGPTPKPPSWGRLRRWALWTYLVLLAASHLFQEMRSPSRVSGGVPVLTFALPGAKAARGERMAYREWLPRDVGLHGDSSRCEAPARTSANSKPEISNLETETRPPLVLVHGSPSSSYDF